MVVRDLQQEIKSLRTQLKSDYRILGYDELKRNYERMAEERSVLEDAYRQIQEECQILTNEGSAKQIRMLKNVIRQLEQELVESKAEYQRLISRKDKDIEYVIDIYSDLKTLF